MKETWTIGLRKNNWVKKLEDTRRGQDTVDVVKKKYVVRGKKEKGSGKIGKWRRGE